MPGPYRAMTGILPVSKRIEIGKEAEFQHLPFFTGGMLGLRDIEDRVNLHIKAQRKHFNSVDLSRTLVGVSITPSQYPTAAAVLEADVLLVDLQYWSSRPGFEASDCFKWLTRTLPPLCRIDEGPARIIEICEDPKMSGLVRDVLEVYEIPVTFYDCGSDEELVHVLMEYADALSAIPAGIAKGILGQLNGRERDAIQP